MDPQRIRVVEGLPLPALTVGFVRPAVYVARDLADELAEAELAVVLAHEGAHVARHDPLRLFARRLVAQTLFWIPALRRLADDAAASGCRMNSVSPCAPRSDSTAHCIGQTCISVAVSRPVGSL